MKISAQGQWRPENSNSKNFTMPKKAGKFAYFNYRTLVIREWKPRPHAQQPPSNNTTSQYNLNYLNTTTPPSRPAATVNDPLDAMDTAGNGACSRPTTDSTMQTTTTPQRDTAQQAPIIDTSTQMGPHDRDDASTGAIRKSSNQGHTATAHPTRDVTTTNEKMSLRSSSTR